MTRVGAGAEGEADVEAADEADASVDLDADVDTKMCVFFPPLDFPLVRIMSTYFYLFICSFIYLFPYLFKLPKLEQAWLCI